MKEYFDFSLTNKQKIRAFANKITPPNWYVYLLEEIGAVDFLCDSNRLYIQLNIRDAFDKPPIERPTFGFMENRMIYTLDPKRAYVKVFLQPPPITWLEMKHLLVHELAHVVELRWKGFRKKTYREDFSVIAIEKEDITDQDLSPKKVENMVDHTKSFLNAHALMKKRAKKVKAAKIGWAKFFNDMVNYND